MDSIKQRYIDDAMAKNMTIVGHVRSTRFLFKRDTCGHVFEADICSVRHNNNSWCRECASELLTASEERLGLTFVEKVDNIRNKYIINSCNHYVILYKANIVRNEFILCAECERIKLLYNLEKHGLELVEYRTTDDINVCEKNKVAKVRFKDCGHEVNRYRSFKQDYGSCEICAENKKKAVYESNGLVAISKISTVKSLFKFTECGHERIMYNSAALRGNCLCQECNESPFNKKSKIYIIKIFTNDGHEFIKFGYGKDIANRVREYRMKGVKEHSVLFEKDFDSGTAAMLVEKAVHKTLKGRNLPTDFARKYLTRGGFTECYPLWLFDEIVRELSNNEKEANLG